MAQAAMHSGNTHERQPNFRHRKKKENRKTERGEFITPPRPTGRRSNKISRFDRAIFKTGNGESGNPGIGESGNRGIRESGNPGIGESGNPGIGESGNRGIRESGNRGIRESGNPGIGESRNRGIRESGNPGIGESGNHKLNNIFIAAERASH